MGINSKKLMNKVALVTGSSRGIGRSIALRFAMEGAKVVVTYNTQEEQAQDVCKEILGQGGQCLCAHLDATSRSNVCEVLIKTQNEWGRLDILVNNAGYLEQKPFEKITEEEWDYTLACNLKSVFLCTQETSGIFKRQNSGCIINISSMGGQIGGTKAPHYAAAKAGVISFTKSAAKLLASYGVRVNAIAPGFIRTDMYDDIISRESEDEIVSGILLSRVGEAEDVTAAALYLASEESSYITGHVLNVNGGLFLGAGS